MKRRTFLKNSILTAIGVGFGSGFGQSALAQSDRFSGTVQANTDKVVVAINLFGGNDGLNTVVPLGQYARYLELRPTLALTQSELLPVAGGAVALNPGMTQLQSLFNNNKVAIIQGVGFPRNGVGLFDHERSQFGFQSGYTNGAATNATGWLGRYLESIGGTMISPGVDFGGGGLLLRGTTKIPLAIDSIESFDLYPGDSEDWDLRRQTYQQMMNVAIPASPVGEFNRNQRKRALEQSTIVQQQAGNYVPAVQYPAGNRVADKLKECAAMIKADLGVRALSVGFGGFDTHDTQNQKNPGELGYHDFLLKTVSDAVSAFQSDLEAQGLAGRVLTVIFSEFGRTPNENTNFGTDHGFASLMFVVGSTVQGGLYGQYPSLNENDFFYDNLDVNTDFRSVYATILERFYGVNPVSILGQSFPAIQFLA